jgi:hypothetical protein
VEQKSITAQDVQDSSRLYLSQGKFVLAILKFNNPPKKPPPSPLLPPLSSPKWLKVVIYPQLGLTGKMASPKQSEKRFPYVGYVGLERSTAFPPYGLDTTQQIASFLRWGGLQGDGTRYHMSLCQQHLHPWGTPTYGWMDVCVCYVCLYIRDACKVFYLCTYVII